MQSIIQKLKSEGVLQLFFDFRSGTLDDLSGKGNVITVSGSPVFNKDGLQYAYGTTLLSVPDNANLRTANFTHVYFGKLKPKAGISILFCKRDTTGINYEEYGDIPTRLVMFDGTNESTCSFTVAGTEYIGTDLTNGGKPNWWKNGVYVGAGNVNLTCNTSSTPSLYLGSIWVASPAELESTTGAWLIISRVLTATEHALLYAELSNMHWPKKTLSRSTPALEGPRNGLVGWWRLDDTVGNIAPDSSGNGMNGTIKGGETTMNSSIGSSVFGYGTGYIEVANNALLNNPAVGTWSWWIRLEPGYLRVIPISKDGDGGYYFQIGTTDNSGRLTFRYGSATGNFGTIGDFPTNEWCHGVFVFDGTNCTAYVNGRQLSGSFAATAPTGQNDKLWIGAYSSDGNTDPTGYYVKGGLKDVRIYNRVLDPKEILDMFNKGKKALAKTDYGDMVSIAPEGTTNKAISNTIWKAI